MLAKGKQFLSLIRHPNGTLALTPDFSKVHVAQSLIFCVVFCRSLFTFTLYVLRFKLLITPLISSMTIKSLKRHIFLHTYSMHEFRLWLLGPIVCIA